MLDREDITALIASLASAVGAVASWIVGIQVLTLIVSGFVVSVLTLYFNSRIQKRAWKREVTIKQMDEIYGPLYLDVGNVLSSFSVGSLGGMSSDSETWSRIRKNYHYRIIEPNLRNRLENFYALVNQVSKNGVECVRLAERAVLKSAREKFGADIERADWMVYGLKDGVAQATLPVQIERGVINGQNPIDCAKREYSGMDEWRMRLSLKRFASNQMNPEEADRRLVEEIFGRAMKEVVESPKVKVLRQDTIDLIGEGAYLKEKLGQMVETPWRI